ncbi:MAG: hypothetical protein JWQ04_2606 [Pedosphaera sp.]|nr:hypothetical protein [Pedosphaera sp.]
MNQRTFLKTAAALLLLVLSLFSYSREMRQLTADGGSTSRIQIDGATLVSVILAIVAISSARSFGGDVKRLSIRFGLPAALPKVPYQILPLLFILFLLIGWSGTSTPRVDGRLVVIQSGWGDSPFKFVVLILLLLLVYTAKLRKRLAEISEKA